MSQIDIYIQSVIDFFSQIDLYFQSTLDFLTESFTPESITKFLVVYFFIVWISLIVWVIKDISVRTNSILFQLFCVLIILVGTPFSIVFYLLVRPRRTLYDLYFEDIEEDLDIFYEIVDEIKNERKQDEKKIVRNLIKHSIGDGEEEDTKNFKKKSIVAKQPVLREEGEKEEEEIKEDEIRIEIIEDEEDKEDEEIKGKE